MAGNHRVMTMGSKGDPDVIEVLRALSGRIGAEYVAGELPRWSSVQSHGRVLARVGPWTVTIGVFTFFSTRVNSSTWAEVHAPFVKPDGFRFTVVPAGFLSRLFKRIGWYPCVDMGFPDFDEAFCVKATDNDAAKAFLADEGLRRLFLAQPSLQMEIYDRTMPWASMSASIRELPGGLGILYSRINDAVLDVDRLKGLFDLSVAVLERSCEVGLARREPPGIEIRGQLGTAPVAATSQR